MHNPFESTTLTSAPLGARPNTDGTTTFRVWAPAADRVAVEVNGERTNLTATGGGFFDGEAPARVGEDYVFVLDAREHRPDPCSRWQPEGLLGPSRVVDLESVCASSERSPVALEDLVLYELHIGTFSDAGTFDGAIPRLPELRELGVTAIEVMPIATFAGNHGWGYDGVYTFAPHQPYGGPAGFA